MLSTPTRQRSTVSQSRPPASARGRSTPRASAVQDLPPYETPEAPLTAEGQRQLSALLHSQALTQLNAHLKQSVDLLTTSAGEITTQLIDAQDRYQILKEKRRNARQSNENDDEEDEEFQLLGEKEQKVGEVTARMEEKMRQLVDSETRLSELTDSVRKIEKEEAEALSAAIGVRQTRGQRRLQRRRQQRDDDDDDDDEEDSQDENYEGTPEREIREGNAQNPPSRRFENSLANGTQEWNSMSLTER